jgi:prepilin-type N-terminal cleavage/methylation domain-containing protein
MKSKAFTPSLFREYSKTQPSKTTNARLVGGFTLVELLVTMAIFLIVIGAATSIFVSALKGQRKALAIQEILNQTSYSLEYMSRAMRMAQKEVAAPSCLSQNGLNYQLTRGGKGIKFRNYSGICQEFFLEGGQLKQLKSGAVESLTSENFEITSLNLNLIGPSELDDFQPRVTIAFTIKGKGQKPEEQTEMKVQTTISQRNVDTR